MTSKSVSFGTTKNGTSAALISLTNASGVEARFCDYGATWVSMIIPDKDNNFEDVLLGFDDVSGYETNPFVSSVVGRYANRISGGSFALGGTRYNLDLNEDNNHLHGGTDNLSVKVWRWEKDTAKNLIRFTCESPAGESGYPGNLKVSVIYQLTDTNKLIIKYEASTDSPTHVNLTNHAYFNLGACPNIHQHKLRLEVDRYTPVNHSSIPTGDISDIPGSLDFRTPSALGEKIHQRETLNEQGLDHNLVFTNHDGTLRLQGEMVEPVCGRTLSLATTEPAVQVYTANHLDGILGKHSRIYDKHSGVCLETQHYPDSPNQPIFPSTLLVPGEVFESTTVFQFGVLN